MQEHKKWFSFDIPRIQQDLETDIDSGLNTNEVRKRQDRDGKNRLSARKKDSNLKRFLKQFNDVLIYVLIAASIITFLLEQYMDTTVIVLVIIINSIIGFIQENKAEKALDSIKKMLSLHANVIRNHERMNIDAEDLVKGDIVLLRAGDKVPADIRLIQCHNLSIDESTLTGESVSIEKSTQTLSEDTVLGDRTNMAFSGTSVTSGTGRGIVVETGNNTELGKINKSIAQVSETKTPLLTQTAKFGKQISFAIVGFGIVLFIFSLFLRDYPISELGLSIIAMIVAAIPEGLPAIMSIILAIGVQNMAKKNAIVRNLPSVETLGSVSVICSDKTGTLTKNEMTVRSLITPSHSYEITGLGYQPDGKILLNGNEADIETNEELKQILLCMKTANDASLSKDEKAHWTINGEPTDGSLITLAEKANHPLADLKIEHKIPFDSEYKYMAVLTSYQDKKYIFMKGAPDRLFDLAEANGTSFDRRFWEKKMINLAKKGERVLGAAYKKVPNEKESIDHDDLKGDLVFLGLAGIIDPPREEAIQAIEECKHAGIKVKMITGDHPETAHAIGKQMGIGNGHGAIEGKAIDKMSDEELQQAVREYDIFARTSPSNKLRLVEALQKNGEICSMTGDGVNDAPSLKKADIGVAMGIKGTEVAKDSSEMILTDDNFTTIIHAVEEGRRVYDNLKKTILFILPTNGAEALLVAGSILLGMASPLSPVQILWVNMITAVTISLALAFENLEKGAMNRPPRPRHAPLLNRYYVFRIVYVSIIIGMACLFIFNNLINQGYNQALASTIVLNVIVFAELFYLYNCKSEKDPAFSKDFFKNKVALLVTALLIFFELAITYIPIFNIALGTAPMSLTDWSIPISIGIIVFIVVEIEKWITRKRVK